MVDDHLFVGIEALDGLLFEIFAGNTDQPRPRWILGRMNDPFIVERRHARFHAVLPVRNDLGMARLGAVIQTTPFGHLGAA